MSERDNIAAENRKARFNYEFLDRLEAGIVLVGSEAKSLRKGGTNITDAFAEVKNEEIYLLNADIPVLKNTGVFSHEPRRARKLLLNKKEIKKLIGKMKDKGITIVATKIFFNRRGIAKVELQVARGKREYEKRDTIKKRDWNREKERLMRS